MQQRHNTCKAEKEEPAAAAKKVDKPEAEKKEPAAAAAEEEEGEETEATAEKRREAEALKQKLEARCLFALLAPLDLGLGCQLAINRLGL